MDEVSLPDGVFINWTDTYSQYKPLSPEITKILANHLEWLSGRKAQETRDKRADLSGANLSNADLRGADLRYAYLYGADLRSAFLFQADLRGANLTGANLRSAYMDGADLTGARIQWLKDAGDK